MNSIQELTTKFLQIKEKGFVPNTRPNNQDGGIGNTLEDLLGIQENNLTQADFKDIEIKSQRHRTSPYSPKHPHTQNVPIITYAKPLAKYDKKNTPIKKYSTHPYSPIAHLPYTTNTKCPYKSTIMNNAYTSS